MPQSSADLGRFDSDLANDGPIIGATQDSSFVVPGSHVGAVGELQCVVGHHRDGSWTGNLQETVERVDGVRLAVRALSLGHAHLEAVTVADGVLTWEATDETHPELADRVRAISSQALVGHLDRVAALLAGQTQAEPPRPPDDVRRPEAAGRPRGHRHTGRTPLA